MVRMGPRLLAAPDKFRGTLSAPEVVDAVRAAASAVAAPDVAWEVIGQPMADGGEGLLDAFGGPNRTDSVTGPAGTPVDAAWLFDADQQLAVIESSLASGLIVAGGAEGNDPMTATSRGTGELLALAVRAGARRVIVGLGGSAMTDGGLGAVEAVRDALGVRALGDLGVELRVACDVRTAFTDAAVVFGPQKGATPEQVEELTARLHDLQERYRSDELGGVDLADVPGAGAAGGLGGGLVALGGRLEPGLDLVADQVGLVDLISSVSLVVTGEGALDEQSFNGKVVGGVAERAAAAGVPVLVLAGTVRPDAPQAALAPLAVVDLSERYGTDRSWGDTGGCVRDAVAEHLSTLARPAG